MAVANERLSLLHAILARPYDDDLRLAYARVLEDEGDEGLAEFIHAQVRLAGARLDDDT